MSAFIKKGITKSLGAKEYRRSQFSSSVVWGRTERPADGQTDPTTDEVSYRGASSRIKIRQKKNYTNAERRS
jgi:hypothetical protein